MNHSIALCPLLWGRNITSRRTLHGHTMAKGDLVVVVVIVAFVSVSLLLLLTPPAQVYQVQACYSPLGARLSYVRHLSYDCRATSEVIHDTLRTYDKLTPAVNLVVNLRHPQTCRTTCRSVILPHVYSINQSINPSVYCYLANYNLLLFFIT